MHDLQTIVALNAVAGARSNAVAPEHDPLEVIDVARYVGMLRNNEGAPLTVHEAQQIADYLVAAYGIQE